MVEKKGVRKFEILGLFFVLVIVSFLLFVLAAPTVQSPVAFGNYSGTMNVSVTTAINASENDYNVSVYYNATGGNVDLSNGTFLVTISNSSAEQNIFENASVNIAGLTDGKIYNFSFYADNGTDQEWSTSVVNITIDHTAPNVTFSGITNTINNGNYSGTIVINVSANDATIGMDSVYFNITNSTSVQHNFTKASVSGGYYNLTLVTTGFVEGVYNVTVYANDTQLNNLNNTEKIKITIDNTAPYEINFTSTTVNNGNYSGSLVVNISILDALSGSGIVFFNVTNSSGSQNATYTASCSGIYCNATIPTSSFPDGIYNITAWTNDDAGNSNNTAKVYSLTFDNTAPTGSVSCSPANVVSGNTVTCSCAPTDATSGVNTALTSITASPSTSNTGTYTSSCSFADLAGNTGSASTTYRVEQGGGIGSSGSGSGTTSTFSYTKSIPQNGKEFSEVGNLQFELKAKERVKIMINSEQHHVGVKSVSDTKATIEIASDPVEVELAVGEDAKIDVDADSYYDVYVKLNSIDNGKADVTIEYLHEALSEGTSGEVETSGEVIAGEETAEIEKETNLTWLWVILVLVVIAFAIWFFMGQNNK